MIRLGSLAGYAFSGPRVLGGYSPPAGLPAVFAVLYKPDPDRERFAVVYVGEAADLSAVGLPFKHRRSPCWTARAGSKWKLHVATLELAGVGHRAQVVRELVAVYAPKCNEEQYDSTWRAEWIGEYSAAPNTQPIRSRGVGGGEPGSDR